MGFAYWQRWFLYVALILASSGVMLFASGDTLVIPPDSEQQQYPLHPYLAMFVDSSGDVTIDDVLSAGFADNFRSDDLSPIYHFGSDAGPRIGAYWLRLVIRSEKDQPLQWLINFSAERVELFLPDETGSYQPLVSGHALPLSERYFGSSYGSLPCLPMDVQAGQITTVYLRLRGISPPGVFHASVFSKEKYNDANNRHMASHLFILGILVAVAVYHLFVYFFQRKADYLLLCLFVLSVAAIEAMFSGHLHQFIVPHLGVNAGFAPLFWAAFYVMLYLFSRSYLDLRTQLPAVDKVWAGLTILIVLLSGARALPVILAGGLADANPIFQVLAKLSLYSDNLAIVIALVTAVVLRYRGYTPAGIYLFAMSIYAIMLLNTNLRFFLHVSLLPVDIPNYVQLLALVGFFSLGTARRMRTMEDVQHMAEKAEIAEYNEALRLQELDEFKSRFFTNITHEFRTPLTIILGMADQIRTQPSTWLHRGTQLINQNAMRLLDLVNRILDLSKLEAGALPMHYTQGDIVAYIRYIVESLRSKALDKQVALRMKCPAGALVMDYDAAKLSDILTNLLANAIHYTPQGGSVVVDCRVEDDDQLVVSVEDTGIGISATDLPHIFDRFYQGEHGEVHTQQGTGIGLSLTRELVHCLGGEITVRSRPGEGTLFTVALPITHEAPMMGDVQIPEAETSLLDTAGQNRVAAHHDGSRGRVLVIDDNTDVITYVTSILQPQYDILTAPDGRAGLKVAMKYVPDIILTDVMMPQMDGFKMCRRLKEDVRTSHIPVILLTARADHDAKIEGLRIGADAYLRKPFDKTELLVRVQNLIASRESLRERYRDFGFVETIGAATDRHPEDDFMHALRQEIDTHLSDPDFTIETLCHDLGMSRAQLYRKFKALTDQTIADFIRKVRLHKAMHLLKTTDMNVTEVSIEVGYKNLSTFSKGFSEEFGITPSSVSKTHV